MLSEALSRKCMFGAILCNGNVFSQPLPRSGRLFWLTTPAFRRHVTLFIFLHKSDCDGDAPSKIFLTEHILIVTPIWNFIGKSHVNRKGIHNYHYWIDSNNHGITPHHRNIQISSALWAVNTERDIQKTNKLVSRWRTGGSSALLWQFAIRFATGGQLSVACRHVAHTKAKINVHE